MPSLPPLFWNEAGVAGCTGYAEQDRERARHERAERVDTPRAMRRT